MVTSNTLDALQQRVLDAISDLVYVYDLAARETRYVNARWGPDFGYSVEDMRARGPEFLSSIVHPDDLSNVLAHHAALRTAAHDEAQALVYRIRRKNGQYAWLESRDRPFTRDANGRVDVIVGVARDVTREQELESRRAESEARFQAMIEHLPDAVFIAGTDARLIEANSAACEQLGRSRAELLGMAIPEFVAPEYHELVRNNLQIPGPKPYLESRHLRKDGTRVPVEVAVVPMLLDGKPVLLGVARDLTLRREAEARSREEADLRAAVIANAVEGVCVYEETAEAPFMHFSVWNRRMTEIFGYEMEEMNALDWYQTVYGDEATRSRAIGHMARIRRGDDLAAEEWPITTKAGEQRYLLISTKLLPTPDGRVKVLAVMHDVTNRLKLEASLRDAQRLESIGRLAGAVAHDFNNLLQAILGGACLLQGDDALDETQRTTASEIYAAAQRGSDLTRRLLTFSRRQRAEVRPIDLGRQVDETLRVARRLLGVDVRLESSLARDCWIRADPGMIDQVVMNLLVNARDAMPHGGAVRVCVEAVGAGKLVDGVCLSVADEGEGISDADLPHVFEPFFTTKPQGQGTGIGLATVYGIVTQHGGRISVKTAPNQGAKFAVWLPRIEAANGTRTSAAPESAHHALAILVVDDQAPVRRMTARLLRHLGHRPREAEGPAEALSILETAGSEIDMVLTDVSLGHGESGVDLSATIARRYPNLPVIYMSGYDAVLGTLPLSEGRDFIQKPFGARELERVLSTRMNRTS